MTRRNLLTTLAATPLILTAETSPTRSPYGLWVHIEEQDSPDRLATFVRMETFIRQKTKVTWLNLYTPHHEVQRDAVNLRKFRQSAIEGDTLAVALLEIPRQQSVRISSVEICQLAGVSLHYVYLADVVTYHKANGEVSICKCHWQYPHEATKEFRYA